jgi:hypothetical protein
VHFLWGFLLTIPLFEIFQEKSTAGNDWYWTSYSPAAYCLRWVLPTSSWNGQQQ